MHGGHAGFDPSVTQLSSWGGRFFPPGPEVEEGYRFQVGLLLQKALINSLGLAISTSDHILASRARKNSPTPLDTIPPDLHPTPLPVPPTPSIIQPTPLPGP